MDRSLRLWIAKEEEESDEEEDDDEDDDNDDDAEGNKSVVAGTKRCGDLRAQLSLLLLDNGLSSSCESPSTLPSAEAVRSLKTSLKRSNGWCINISSAKAEDAEEDEDEEKEEEERDEYVGYLDSGKPRPLSLSLSLSRSLSII